MGFHLNLRLALYECKLALSRGISLSSLCYGRHILCSFYHTLAQRLVGMFSLLSFSFFSWLLHWLRYTHWEANFVDENAICV